jgi:membrane-bound acyltransferase YfiQ involved in biofilm formation
MTTVIGNPTATVADALAADAPVRVRRHVHEADMVRVLTFACVIAVHTVSNTNSIDSRSANGVMMLLHFTREAFFVLTAFVLMHSAVAGQPNRAGTGWAHIMRMWRRRLPAVLVPYTVWTVAYEGLNWWRSDRSQGLADWLHALAQDYAFGTAWYHLYFLLVSIQIYLLFPVIQWLVQATRGHHVVLLSISGSLQLALLTWLTYIPPRAGWLHDLDGHEDVLIVSYQFFVFLGAVAACHFEAISGWVRAHRGQVAVGAIAAGVLAETWFLIASHRESPLVAADPLQPMMVVWSVAVVLALLAIGGEWAQHRRAGSMADRLLTIGSDRSFGIYLSHPAILWLVLWVDAAWLPAHLHGAPLSIVAYLLTVLGSIVVTEAFRRSPLSLALTGRSHLT